jgi:hypothetical protein
MIMFNVRLLCIVLAVLTIASQSAALGQRKRVMGRGLRGGQKVPSFGNPRLHGAVGAHGNHGIYSKVRRWGGILSRNRQRRRQGGQPGMPGMRGLDRAVGTLGNHGINNKRGSWGRGLGRKKGGQRGGHGGSGSEMGMPGMPGMFG